MRHDVSAPRHVLIVDDNPQIAGLLELLLTREGYTVEVAGDGREALRLVERRCPDLVLLDLDLPHVGGYEVCRRLKADPRTRLTPIVIITAQTGSQSKLDAWELGADDYLTKPFHTAEVVTRCRSLLRIKRLIEERDSAEAVVFALARAVEAKSPYTHGHSERVRDYCLLLAWKLELPAADRTLLSNGALLHDIGKISVPDAILNKPGPLTPEEYAVVKEHPAQGARIAEPLATVRDVMPLIRWHHERPDGGGYPDGLAGDAIPPLVRLLSVADVYDSLASDRPYRPRLALNRCLETLETIAAEGGLDAELVAVFCALQREGAGSFSLSASSFPNMTAGL